MSTQNKFAIGDRVRLVTTEHGYICGEDDDRLFQVGCIGTVTNTDWTDGATIAMYGYREPMYFSYDEFELLEEACKQPPVVEWNGNGLPPVGTVCEFLYYDDYESNYLYEKCKVLAHDDGCVIFKPLDGKHKGELFQKYPGMTCGDNQMFRPIKTKEQLREEAKVQERERIIEDITRVISSKISDKRAAESLYELGYRKMEGTND